MTSREDLAKLAKDCLGEHLDDRLGSFGPAVESLTALLVRVDLGARAEEREACAKECEAREMALTPSDDDGERERAAECRVLMQRIRGRARGKRECPKSEDGRHRWHMTRSCYGSYYYCDACKAEQDEEPEGWQ